MAGLARICTTECAGFGQFPRGVEKSDAPHAKARLKPQTIIHTRPTTPAAVSVNAEATTRR